MNMKRTHNPLVTRRSMLGGFASLTITCALPAWAQNGAGAGFPAKMVTIIVPYSAGGGTDIIGRSFAQKLADIWGQSVVVDNRTGANGVIGTSYVAKAHPDGLTLLLVVGSHAINPVLMKQLPYDTAKAFTPITNIATSPMVLVAAADGPFKTLKDFVDAARKEETPVGYSEGQTRLTGELIRQAGNLKLTGVAYKGGAPIMVDVMGGHLPAGVTSVLTALPHVKAGKLRVIGVAAPKRMSIFPDAMTFQEAGLEGVESFNWYGMFGPAGVPDAVVAKINESLHKAATDPVLIKQMQDQGASFVLSSPADFRKFLDGEAKKWSAVAKRGGIQPE